MAEKTKVEYLADYLEVDPSTIEQSKYDENVYETEDGEEYAVYTDDDADREVREQIVDSLWAFNPDFIVKHMRGYDELSSFDERETVNALEEVQSKLAESANPLVKAIIEDIDEFVEDAVDSDGRGHFISSYDGEELELADDKGYIQYYAYRIN